MNSCDEDMRYAYLRFSSWKNPIENGFYFAEHFSQVQVLAQTFFLRRFDTKGTLRKSLDLSVKTNSSMLHDLNKAPLEEIALLVFSPTIVQNGDYIYAADSIIKEKCQISGICKGCVDEAMLTALLSYPSKHSLSVLVFFCATIYG